MDGTLSRSILTLRYSSTKFEKVIHLTKVIPLEGSIADGPSLGSECARRWDVSQKLLGHHLGEARVGPKIVVASGHGCQDAIFGSRF